MPESEETAKDILDETEEVCTEKGCCDDGIEQTSAIVMTQEEHETNFKMQMKCPDDVIVKCGEDSCQHASKYYGGHGAVPQTQNLPDLSHFHKCVEMCSKCNSQSNLIEEHVHHDHDCLESLACCFKLSDYKHNIRQAYIVNKFSRRIQKKNKTQKSAQQLLNFNQIPQEIVKIYINIKEERKKQENLLKNQNLTKFNNMLQYDLSSSRLSAQFLIQNKIKPDDKVAIIDGKTFDPSIVGYEDHIPSCRDYLFLNFKTNTNPEKKFRLFQCLHQKKDGNYVSEPCGKVLNGLIHMLNHMRIHTQEKPYECIFCSTSFSQLGNLDKHYMVHAGIKTINCPHCSLTFDKKYNLDTHLKSVQKRSSKKKQQESFKEILNSTLGEGHGHHHHKSCCGGDHGHQPKAQKKIEEPMADESYIPIQVTEMNENTLQNVYQKN